MLLHAPLSTRTEDNKGVSLSPSAVFVTAIAVHFALAYLVFNTAQQNAVVDSRVQTGGHIFAKSMQIIALEHD